MSPLYLLQVPAHIFICSHVHLRLYWNGSQSSQHPSWHDLVSAFRAYEMDNARYVRGSLSFWPKQDALGRRRGQTQSTGRTRRTGKDDSQQQGEPEGLNFIEKMRRISMDTEAQTSREAFSAAITADG